MRITSSQRLSDTAQTAPVTSGVRLASSEPIAILRTSAVDMAKFTLLLIEIVGLACVVKRYQLESEAFFEIVVFAAAGFAIQYFLPADARGGFFLFLSVASLASVLGIVAGLWVLVIGLGLLAIVHLPASAATKAGLLVLASTALAALRVGWRRRRGPPRCGRSWARCSCSDSSCTPTICTTVRRQLLGRSDWLTFLCFQACAFRCFPSSTHEPSPALGTRENATRFTK